MGKYFLRLSLFPVLWVVGFLLLPATMSYGQGKTRATLAPRGSQPYILGDTISITVEIDPRGEALTGLEFYLTLDSALFRPVLTDEGRPFTPGGFINEDAFRNDMHGDSLHLGPDGNDIPHWQLDYVQFTSPGYPRPVATQRGTAATFEMEIIGLPYDPSMMPTLSFESTSRPQRQTGYFLLIGDLSARAGFANYPATTPIPVAGLAIIPTIPDTIVPPGSGLDLYLGDYFYSNVVDSSAAIWTEQIVSPVPLPGGATFAISPAGPSPSSRLVVTTSPANHFILDANIFLEGTDPGPPIMTFYDQQPLQIIVDHLPVFDVPLPSFTFDEDTQLPYLANADGGGVLFTDQDDAGSDLTIWLEPDSLVHLNYDSATDTVTFYSDANWYGVQVARLFVEDALGLSADTLLTFTVNSINDTPVVNFDSVSVLGDTVVIYRATPDTLDLSLFVTDVDDPVLTWSVNNPDPANLIYTLLPGDRLKLLAADAAAYVDIDLTITATDDSSATDSDTLVVSIRSWPPVIGSLPSIIILAGEPDTLDLNPLVSDNDTPDALMTWSFEVVDYITKVPDPQVSYTYDQASQTVIFNTPPGYAATDLLRLTVEDDDNNTDADSTRLAVFATLNPTIFPLDTVIVYRDTSTDVRDLDDYVLDPVYDPEDLSWQVLSGGDSLENVDIRTSDHVLVIDTDPSFFGWDSVTIIVTNDDGYADTSGLVVRVIPRYDGPPVWYTLPDVVENVFSWVDTLFVLTDVCVDDFTPGDQIIFTGYVDPDPAKPLNLTIDPVTLVASISVPALGVYDTWLYFTAKDNQDSVSYSDTVIVKVKDSYSPVWSQIPTILMETNQTDSSLLLQGYLDDTDTPLGSLSITWDSPSPHITVTYNQATTRVTIQASGIESNSLITFTATDPQGNASSVKVRVIVLSIPDETAPEGGLTYFFNPAADRWIHYVLVADSTTSWHNTTYTFNSREIDLKFTLRDSLPGTLTWIAPFHFVYAGTYHLSAVLADDANPTNYRELTLSHTVSFSKAIGDVLASPDRRLTVSYPAAPTADGKLVIVSESVLPEPASRRLAAISGIKEHSENADREPVTVYSLDTNLPEPLLVTISCLEVSAAALYYSFYEVDGEELLRIETYRGSDGRFEAAVPLGRDVIFARSNTPANRAPLPSEELSCYPNPFNATIQVRFLLRREDRGRIVIYDLLGREVFASPRQPLGPGAHLFSWRGIDQRGLLVPSGAYFIRLETDGGTILTRKVTLLK